MYITLLRVGLVDGKQLHTLVYTFFQNCLLYLNVSYIFDFYKSMKISIKGR